MAEMLLSAEASECADEQGKFWEYADELYANQSSINPDYLSQAAFDIGLNKTKFDKCLASGKYAAKVQDHIRQAAIAGARGTPYNIIIATGQEIPLPGVAPYGQLKAIIDELLK